VLALFDGHHRTDNFYLKVQADSSKNFLPYHQRDLSACWQGPPSLALWIAEIVEISIEIGIPI